MDKHVQEVGTLQAVAGGGIGPGDVWGGAISAADCPALPDAAPYFVACASDASTRCIDGRPLQGYANNPALQTRPLGPQIAGGTPVVALLYHLVAGTDDTTPTLDQDLATVITMVRGAGLGIGGHIDDHHGPNDEDTGCGAVDKMLAILDKMQKPEAQIAAHTLAAQLLADQYDEALAAELDRRLSDFRLSAEHYFEYNQPADRYDYKQHSVALLRQQAANDPVEVVTGAHLEKGLVVNTAPDTTFNRDAFTAVTGNTAQLFDYDVWFVTRLAGVLFPDDEAQRRRFILLHVLYSIATAMVLIDGTLKLFVR